MFYLIFGLIWTTICSIIIYGFYDPNSSDMIIVNGETLTYEEFSQLLWPKLLLGFVLLIGIIIFFIGLRIVIRDILTNKHGKKTIGLLLNVVPNGQTINDQEAFNAVFLVLNENRECKVYQKNIGINNLLYIPNEFYELLLYKNNINILNPINENMIPREAAQLLNDAVYTDKNPYFFSNNN